ncbi:MAG: hypothetical protein ACI8X5_001732 [Planctomycetota bacterium]|jgi:hypothetical protein
MNFLSQAFVGFAAISSMSIVSPCAEDDGTELWLARLTSGSAAEREGAQRWLGIHLRESDYPLLARYAGDADAETSRRLASALSSEDRHLGLTIFLQNEVDESLSALGRLAFDDLLSSWCPGALDKSVSRHTVERLLDDHVGRSFAVSEQLIMTDAVVDRYSRLLDLGVPVVLSPDQVGTEAKIHEFEGSMLDVMTELCSENGLTYRGVGDWAGEEPSRTSWIMVSAKRSSRSKSGGEQIAEWCDIIEAGAPSAAACARALGACGWPAALRWLDQRWAERGDESALEGLLTAAAFGRVGRSLQEPAARAMLLARSEAATSRLQAERIARALIGAGAMTTGGELRAAELLDSWATLDNRQRWIRLYIIEGQRAGAESVRNFVRAMVLNPQPMAPALRFQAMRALAALPEREAVSIVIPNLEMLAVWAKANGHERDLLVLLDALSAEVGELGFGAGSAQDRLLLRWYLRKGEAERAAAILIRCVARSSTTERAILSDQMLAWRVEVGPRLLEASVELALSELSGSELMTVTEVALLGGCLNRNYHEAIFDRIVREPQLTAQEFEELGALVAGPRGGAAQALLEQALAQPNQIDPLARNGLVLGLERALRTLRASGQSERANAMIQSVWRVVAPKSSVWHEGLNSKVWPQEGSGLPIDLSRLERRIPAEF